MEEFHNALMLASRIDDSGLSKHATIYYEQDNSLDQYGFSPSYAPPHFQSPLDEANWPIHESIDFMIYNPSRG